MATNTTVSGGGSGLQSSVHGIRFFHKEKRLGERWRWWEIYVPKMIKSFCPGDEITGCFAFRVLFCCLCFRHWTPFVIRETTCKKSWCGEWPSCLEPWGPQLQGCLEGPPQSKAAAGLGVDAGGSWSACWKGELGSRIQRLRSLWLLRTVFDQRLSYSDEGLLKNGPRVPRDGARAGAAFGIYNPGSQRQTWTPHNFDRWFSWETFGFHLIMDP